MKQPDPLRTNLGLITGDLMVVAYRTRQSLDKAWQQNGPDRDLQVAQHGETLLRFGRAIGGFLRLDRQEKADTEPPGR